MLFFSLLSILGAACSAQATLTGKYSCYKKSKNPYEFDTCIESCQVLLAKSADCQGRLWVPNRSISQDWGDVHVKMQNTKKGLGQYFKANDISANCQRLCASCIAPMSFSFSSGLKVSFEYTSSGGERSGSANSTESFTRTNSTEESLISSGTEESITNSTGADVGLQDRSAIRRSYPIQKRAGCGSSRSTYFATGAAAVGAVTTDSVKQFIWEKAQGGVWDHTALTQSIANSISFSRNYLDPILVDFTKIFGNQRKGAYSIIIYPAVANWQAVIDKMGSPFDIALAIEKAVRSFEDSRLTYAHWELFQWRNGHPLSEILGNVEITRTATGGYI